MGKRYTMARTADRSVIVMIAITAVLFVASVSYVFYSRNIPLQAQAETSTALAVHSSSPETESLIDTSQKDTDGDGLSDWEEVLWSTDPNNADTDGDGVHDKEQVYSPKNVRSDSLTLQAHTTDTPLTLTDVASRDLFASYLYSLKEGEEFTPVEQDKIASQALQAMVPFFPRSMYTKDDVRSIPTTQENRLRYGASIKTILDGLASVTNETIPLYKLAYGDRAEAIDELDEISKQYSDYIDELKKISTPEDAVEMHTALVSTLENYVLILNGFTYFETDPMRSAISINTVQDALYKVRVSFDVLKNYIVKHSLHKNNPFTTPS